VRRIAEAITAFKRGIGICAELGDHYGQAQTLGNLGRVHADLGDPERARQRWDEAAELFTAAGAEDDHRPGPPADRRLRPVAQPGSEDLVI
jgi:tetratricopeptide (TPR) repeat protein